MFYNFNLWYILIPAFLVEATIIGYLTRDLKASPLSDLLMSLMFTTNSIIVFASVWHDSFLGIVQLAEDMSVGYEDPIFAFGFLIVGTVGLAAFYVGLQYLFVNFGAITLPEAFVQAERLCKSAKYHIWLVCFRIRRACSRWLSQHYRWQINSQDIVRAVTESADRVDSTKDRTMLVVSVNYRPVWSWRKFHG